MPKSRKHWMSRSRRCFTDDYERTDKTNNYPASLTLDWVPMASSLQWRAFTRTIQLLQQRGNRISVLVGPFNEHLLTGQNLVRYNRLKHNIDTWLSQNGTAHLMLEPLPAELYRDASHPTAEGYEMLSEQIAAHGFLIGP